MPQSNQSAPGFSNPPAGAKAGWLNPIRVLAILMAGLLLLSGFFALHLREGLTAAEIQQNRSQELIGAIKHAELCLTRLESATWQLVASGEGPGAIFEDMRAPLRTALQRIERLAQDNPDQQENLRRLGGLIEARQETLLRLVQRPAADGPLAATREEADGSGGGMQAVREQVNRIEAAESRVVAAGAAEEARGSRDTTRLIIVGNLLAGFCAFLALYISHRAETARARADRRLQEANALQRAVLDGGVYSVVATDPDGLICEFNHGAEVMLGYTREEMVGKQTPTIFHLESEMAERAAELSDHLGRPVGPGFEVFSARALQGETDEREWTFVRKDGSRLPVLLSITALRNAANGITGFLGLARDLTQQKLAETALLSSEQKLGQVLGHAECLVWEARVTLTPGDWDWRMTIYPSALYARLRPGVRRKEGAGLWYRFEIPQQAEMNRRSRAAMETGLPGYVQEFQLMKPEGFVWLRESVSIRPLGDGQFWLVGVTIDVSEHKRLEVALKKSEEQFRNAFDHAGIGMALVGLDGRWLQINRVLHHMLGYTEEEMLARTFQDLTHPEDLAGDLAYKRDVEEGRRSHFQMEKRYIHKSGKIVHVRLTVSLVRDAAGQPQHFISQIEDITARHRAEEELKASQRQLTEIFRSMAEGLVLQDAQGRIVECNAAAESIFGLTRAQLMGLSAGDPRWLALNEDGTPCPADLHPAVITRMTGRSQRGVIMGVKKPDGAIRWVSVNTEAILNEQGYLRSVVSSFADVTERKEALEALAESEERTRLFAEHAPASVAMFDQAMRYLVHSKKWLKDHGLEGRDIIGRSHYEVFPATGEKWKAIHRRGLAGATEINEADAVDRADGVQQWLSWRVQPWKNRGGEIGGIVMFTEDITRRKQLEESLAAARDQALAGSKMKSEFLANVSHEIRTPMNGVLGMADLLMDTALTEDQRQMGGVIQACARNLLTVIDDLLDFSKIEAGKLNLITEEFDLGEQIDQALALMAPRVMSGLVDLASELPDNLPRRLTGDAGRLQQVFVNLLGNALKFTERGSVTVSVQTRPPSAPGHYAFRIEVRDTGIGISAEQKARLFQPFTQADGSTTRRYGGTGLGLAISRQLVELMGGRIGVESEPGKGSVFWLELELAVQAEAPRVMASAGAPVTARPAGTKAPRILVAEDNEANQLVMRLLLGKLGVAYQMVGDGQAVISKLSVGDYAVVLMDCQMPKLDGYETTRLIRNGAAGSDRQSIPIVALTAHAMASDREKCLEAGMDEYLSKPIRLEALETILHRYGVATAPLGPVAPAPGPVSPGEPVLDPGQLAELRALPGGQPGETLLKVLATKFLDSLPENTDRLQRLMVGRAGDELAQVAHRVAGSAASIGATALRKLLLKVEQSARTADWAAMEGYRSELDRQWRLLQDALRRLTASPAP